MNIFVLDEDPVVAARCLFDKHVVKMTLETAQILSTINGGPYKFTHKNHPCVKWTEAAFDNYAWLCIHGSAIANEYTFRYGKTHKSEEIIRFLTNPIVTIPQGKTPFVQCMPDEFKDNDPVKAYRHYYHSKAAFARWTKREQPEWW